jgi:hypothetical protein
MQSAFYYVEKIPLLPWNMKIHFDGTLSKITYGKKSFLGETKIIRKCELF